MVQYCRGDYTGDDDFTRYFTLDTHLLAPYGTITGTFSVVRYSSTTEEHSVERGTVRYNYGKE